MGVSPTRSIYVSKVAQPDRQHYLQFKVKAYTFRQYSCIWPFTGQSSYASAAQKYNSRKIQHILNKEIAPKCYKSFKSFVLAGCSQLEYIMEDDVNIVSADDGAVWVECRLTWKEEHVMDDVQHLTITRFRREDLASNRTPTIDENSTKWNLWHQQWYR